MKQTRLWTWLPLLVVLAIVLAACGAAPPAQVPPTTAPAAETPTEAAAAETPTEAAAAETPTEDAAAEPAARGRGEGDLLRILYWQAPTILNVHLGVGTKDFDASRLILEPLASIDSSGQLVPLLVEEIPTIENGGIAEDLTSITWKLRQDVMWSDGSAFTAADVVFTYEYCADPATSCTTSAYFEGIASVEALDDYTVEIVWMEPTSNQYKTFTSNNGRIIQKAQFENCIGAAASTEAACQAANLAPIGTGPYKLVDFKVGDVVLYEINEYFRDPDKPFFQRVELKGGGDAPSAARAVFQTGEVDWAWNLQVEAAVLDQLVSQGGQGVLVPYNTANVERILFNFTNPDPALGDERGQMSQPHPFLTDLTVRRALTLAIDRQTISEQLYGRTGFPTCTLLWYAPFANGIDEFFDDCAQDLDEANRLLDEAGWERGPDGIRVKDGVRLSVLFQTSVNTLRQKTQELIKADWETIGVETELKSVDAGVFFGSDVGNPDNIGKFYADVQMYTTGAAEPDPTSHICQWVSVQVSQRENEWRGQNNMRWQNAEYDALCAELEAETDPAGRIEIISQLDGIIRSDLPQVPLVARPRVAGASNDLKGYEPSGWDSELWDVMNWYK
ncbi:MAG: peptide ABC transporter substrate-binding protein [Candidatus Viridilinea halotolerans]|uniref:Peptide ABC transporter substrate-binding protein n=1 Tax=Candidatus Viridilinea halotolerans TaxID=2491704 RepID=A0A426TUJ0_9CHLR|nr:MAG: peptide ABC transporter substrate-binding protein [Candidatus Viridilinea halotolerans]